MGSVSEDVVSEEKLFWGDLLASVTERIVRSEVDIVGGGGCFMGDCGSTVCAVRICWMGIAVWCLRRRIWGFGELDLVRGEK